jgi:hypothetical protein
LIYYEFSREKPISKITKRILEKKNHSVVTRGNTRVWQNQPELHRLKCADPFSEGGKDSIALQTV